MGLSRLENFLKSARGTIIYVDPNSLDSTDSIDNSGNSLARPFKTLQRALIESARFSYQRGLNNDRFNKTTILLYPGDHLVDNRPGYIPTGAGTYSERGGQTGLTDLTQWTINTNFDLSTPDNVLYKFNSIYGGVIVPRGTSIVGMDLRKTKIRPLYVPNPSNDNIERSCVLRTTGGCYYWQFTILDADPNGVCYKDYTKNQFVPNFSHHKLTAFEYADGVNPVNIKDTFLTYSDSTRTDLDMYYEKVAAAYGPSSDREITPDYGTGTVDIQPVIDEYRIVGPKGASVGITSIRSGDGVTPSTTIQVTLEDTVAGLSVDTPIQIEGISEAGYDGQYVIATVLSDTVVTYKVQNAPLNPLPATTGSTLNLVVDTVTSASPYIFNISLRSVFGMCGLLADGDKATGFKSMVVAQFTGIGLQKDDNAFAKYNETSGEYEYSDSVSNLHTNSRSIFKPEYENFHIKATNDSFLQLVSIFAIGYAQHFVTENGGDIALNNSNSNFGAKALVASGFKRDAFTQDDYGYITHIIPPREIESDELTVEFSLLNVGITTSKSVGAATTDKLYIYNETDVNTPPQVILNSYHIGAKQNELLNVQIIQNGITTTYSSQVVMPNGPYNLTESSSEKVFTVGRSAVGVSSISSNTLTLTQGHSFINGEAIRIISDNGHLPDGLEPNQVYYAITRSAWNPVSSGIGTNEIRIAKTLNNAINGSVSANAISINSKGGILSVVSRVSDKKPGDIGHPVQWDSAEENWYIGVSTVTNGIYDAINELGTSGLGEATPRTYVTRKPDDRSLIDTLYRVRYVIPKGAPSTARPPIDGFILQESSNIIGAGTTEISQLYSSVGSISSTQLRNPRFIANATWDANVATITSELPHDLKVGDQVKITNVSPTSYNGTYTVTSLVSAKEFSYSLTLDADPGDLTNNTSIRDDSLPYFSKKKLNKTYQIYRTQEVQPHISGSQDGVYYVTLINYSNSPTVTPFREKSFSQPIDNLYPQIDRDNIDSDPDASVSYASPEVIGKVIVDDPRKSVTKETAQSFVVGFGITDIRSTSGTSHTIYTSLDHGLSGIASVGIVTGGLNYGSGGAATLYNARLVGIGTSTTGANATAIITINASGTITNVNILDGGSAYGIGNTLHIVGVATTAGHIVGVVSVTQVVNNINDVISISGISSALNSEYNTLYTVSSIEVGKSKEINVGSSTSISNISVSGIGATLTSGANCVFTGKSLSISSLTYNSVTGLATVGFTTSHGLRINNKVRISGANESVFNGDFIVKNINSLTSAVVSVGIATTTTSATGTLVSYRPVLTSYGGEVSNNTENTSGRLVYNYAGITTTIGSDLLFTDPDATNLNVTNAVSLGFELGDYLLVNDEIFRISSAVTSSNLSVFRSVLGSPRQSHYAGSVVRKIKVTPVELRRNSIIRASGHTFEYLGYGPGNYSTSLPDKQDRVLDRTEIFLAQATKSNGGLVVYTGMDSEGSFYAGNKKINSATGQEETYDTPIPTITGEKETLINIVETQKLFVESSIKIDGGKDKNLTSEFDGPVVFNNKIVSNDDIEANSILLHGTEQVYRRISIGNTQPTTSGNYGDVVFNSQPDDNDYVGWTYITDNTWKPFGWIGYDGKGGVGISTNGTYVGFSTLINFVGSGVTITPTYDAALGITTLTFTATSGGTGGTGAGTTWGITSVGIHTLKNVGIGTTNPTSVLTVSGNAVIAGILTVGSSSITLNGITDTLTVPGGTTTQHLNVSGISTHTGSGIFNSNVYIAGVSTHVGFSTFGGNVYIAGVSTHVGFSTFGGNVYIAGVSTFAGITTVTGSTLFSKQLNVSGVSTFFGVSQFTNSIRIYESDRSNYIGLAAPSTASDLTFTLPNSYGTSGYLLTSDGVGGLYWSVGIATPSPSGIDLLTAGNGISISNPSGPTATITNTGITTVSAGNGMSVSTVSGTATITNTGITTVSAGNGMSVSTVSGTATITNSGVTQLTAGTGMSVDTSTGSVTITNTGISSVVAGTGVSVSVSSGTATFSATGSIPIGGIIMWSGTVATIPSGWALCDGNNSTPDLRTRFIVGASDVATTTYTFSKTTGAVSGGYAPGATGGQAGVGMTVGEMPAHTHTYSRAFYDRSITDDGPDQTNSADFGSANTGSRGSNLFHENRPPYYALAFIMRVS